jgi:hypothetical protein
MNIEERKGFMDRDNAFGKEYSDPTVIRFPTSMTRCAIRSANNKIYLGSPFRLYTRYRFRYRQNISLGFTAEKDEGEEFFQGIAEEGFDFYSAHLFVRDLGA